MPKTNKKNAPQYIKGDTVIIDNGRAYETNLVIKHYPDGRNVVYDVIIQKEIAAPHTPMHNNAPESPVPHLGSLSEQQRVNSDDFYVANISQVDEKVNPIMYNKSYETGNQSRQNNRPLLDRRQQFDTATEVDGQAQASDHSWRDNRGTEVGTNDAVAREKIAQLLKDYRNPNRALIHRYLILAKAHSPNNTTCPY